MDRILHFDPNFTKSATPVELILLDTALSQQRCAPAPPLEQCTCWRYRGAVTLGWLAVVGSVTGTEPPLFAGGAAHTGSGGRAL